MGKKEAEDHFFKWDVPNVGDSVIVAKAGELEDSSTIRKVDTFNESYRLKEVGAVLNWFDITEKPGRLSLNSKMGLRFVLLMNQRTQNVDIFVVGD